MKSGRPLFFLLALALVLSWGFGVSFHRAAREGASFAVFALDIFLGAATLAFLWREISRNSNQAELLNSIVTNIGDGVVAADASGKFTVFNPAARKIMGENKMSDYPDKWAENHGVYYPNRANFVKPEDLPMARALRGEATDGAEFFVKNDLNPEGIFISVTGRPLFDERGRLAGGVVVLTDITKRKLREARVEELNRDLEVLTQKLTQSNKELESFSYSVAHDLRAPLRAITGFGQFLLEDYAARLDDQGRDYIHRIHLGCQRMGQLIDELLALSNITRRELKNEKVDMGALASSIMGELKAAEPERSIEFLDPGNIEAVGDPGLLRIALQNLIGNAWKFTRKTKNARIEIGEEPVCLCGEKIFFVKDNGVGFDMKYSNRMFDPFQRFHSQADFPGEGLGLAIVSRVILRHGGRIWAKGEVGKGAAFYFTLGNGGHSHGNETGDHTAGRG